MPADIDALLGEAEAEGFDAKSELDPENPKDLRELVGDIVAMANTHGGRILIGTKGRAISRRHADLFDSARLDDQVNRFIEPRLGGIKSSLLNDDFLLVEVEKSQNPPHVFKIDGNYQEGDRQLFVFRRCDVFARHSSKSERASRSDYDRWYEEQRKRLFNDVKMVFEANPGARIQIGEGPGVPAVRIAPDHPGAQPVYDLLTSEPFRDLEQELIGVLKGWKTSGQLLNEKQVYKAYSNRTQINDQDILELLLRSCWEKRLPGYYWAQSMGPARLVQVLRQVIVADTYPALGEALKVSALLPRHVAKPLVQLGQQSERASDKKLCKKLESVLRARARKHEALVKALHPWKNARYSVGGGVKVVDVASLNEDIFTEILGTLLHGVKDNRAEFKTAELMTYGPSLAAMQIPESEDQQVEF